MAARVVDGAEPSQRTLVTPTWGANDGGQRRPNRLTASALSASQGLLSFLPDLAEKQKVRRTGLAAVSLPSGAQPPLSTVSRPQAAATLLPHCCCQI